MQGKRRTEALTGRVGPHELINVVRDGSPMPRSMISFGWEARQTVGDRQVICEGLDSILINGRGKYNSYVFVGSGSSGCGGLGVPMPSERRRGPSC